MALNFLLNCSCCSFLGDNGIWTRFPACLDSSCLILSKQVVLKLWVCGPPGCCDPIVGALQNWLCASRIRQPAVWVAAQSPLCPQRLEWWWWWVMSKSLGTPGLCYRIPFLKHHILAWLRQSSYPPFPENEPHRSQWNLHLIDMHKIVL